MYFELYMTQNIISKEFTSINRATYFLNERYQGLIHLNIFLYSNSVKSTRIICRAIPTYTEIFYSMIGKSISKNYAGMKLFTI